MTINTSAWKEFLPPRPQGYTTSYMAEIGNDIYIILNCKTGQDRLYGQCAVKLVLMHEGDILPRTLLERKFSTPSPYNPSTAQKQAVKIILREVEKFIATWTQINGKIREIFVTQDLLQSDNTHESEENN